MHIYYVYIYIKHSTYIQDRGLLRISLRNCGIRRRTCVRESFDPRPDATPVQGVPSMVKKRQRKKTKKREG